ncbi:MAG: type II toxin-antitoxin system VapC family toxin [Thermomicrobiales bacterium]
MIVDTSALVSIAIDEPGCDLLLTALLLPGVKRLSAANLLEAWIVVERRHVPGASDVLDDTVALVGFVIEPVTVGQAMIAREAYIRYGKGSGHPAQLNFGDCFAYALAKETGEPLLFIGNDFSHTDVSSAIPR